jgi:hypothetical protein
MSLQHYLPASYIANFSINTSLPRRERPVFIGDKKTGRIFSAKASKLAAEKDIYTLKEPPEKGDQLLVDKTYSFYEANLPTAIDQLCPRLN